MIVQELAKSRTPIHLHGAKHFQVPPPVNLLGPLMSQVLPVQVFLCLWLLLCKGTLTTSCGFVGHFSQNTTGLDIREGPVLKTQNTHISLDIQQKERKKYTVSYVHQLMTSMFCNKFLLDHLHCSGSHQVMATGVSMTLKVFEDLWVYGHHHSNLRYRSEFILVCKHTTPP